MTADGTAEAGGAAATGDADYTAITAGTQETFVIGQATKSFTIDLLADPVLEGTEYFMVTISLVHGATASAGSVSAAAGNTACVLILDTSGKRKDIFDNMYSVIFGSIYVDCFFIMYSGMIFFRH